MHHYSGRIPVDVIIERLTCVSCGSFRETCPGFFVQDPEDQFSRIIEKFRIFRINGYIAEGTPAADLASSAQEASELYPVTSSASTYNLL